MTREKLAGLVRERRRALGLTQPQVAERADVSVELVRRVETNRTNVRRTEKIEGLEHALEWAPGSIRAVLAGGMPTDVHRPSEPPAPARSDPAPVAPPPSESVDYFALAHHVLALRDTFATHEKTIGEDAREALAAEMARSARDAEESIIRMMPWFDDAKRGEAIDLLVELRKTVSSNATQ